MYNVTDKRPMKPLEKDELKDIMCIYKIENAVNGVVYIGSTVNLNRRISSHIRKLTMNDHRNTDLQFEWNEYGADNFHFEIVELVDDINLLPRIETNYIDEYKERNGVYNKSNPMEEIRRGVKRTPYRGQNVKGVKYKTTQAHILRYLNENFSHLAEQMKSQIEQRIYFEKNKVNEWIIKNIDDEVIRNDERIHGLLHRWHNQNGFSIIEARIYQSEIKHVFNIDIKLNVEILVKKSTQSKLFENKKAKYMRNFDGGFETQPKRKKAKKKKKTVDKPKKEKKLTDNQIVQYAMKEEFDYLFIKLVEKLVIGKYMEFSKVSDFIIKNISVKGYTNDFIEENLKRVLLKYKLSTMNFESITYDREMLNKFGITTYKKSIVSKEFGKKISSELSKIKM